MNWHVHEFQMHHLGHEYAEKMLFRITLRKRCLPASSENVLGAFVQYISKQEEGLVLPLKQSFLKL